MPNGMIDSGAGLANLYYDRWPCQEAKFKEMSMYSNLKVNHGFKKIEAIQSKISMHKGDSSKLWSMLEKRNGELETVEAKYQNKMVVLREKERIQLFEKSLKRSMGE